MAKSNGDQLANYKDLFTNMVTALAGGKVDALSVVGELAQEQLTCYRNSMLVVLIILKLLFRMLLILFKTSLVAHRRMLKK